MARLAAEKQLLEKELVLANRWQRIAEEQRVLLDHSRALAQLVELAGMRRPEPGTAWTAGKGSQAKITELENTVALLEAEITAIRQSTSWRLTAPVRLAKTAYLGLHGAGSPAGRPESGMQARLRGLARRATQQPVLRRFAVTLLARHPALKGRLRAYLAARPHPSAHASLETLQSALVAPSFGATSSDAQRQAWNALSRATGGREQP
jgi:hypothetical protein